MTTSPFPGMDPYLESSFVWPDFHHSLAEEIKRQINRQVGANYFASVELKTFPSEVEISTVPPIFPDAGIYKRVNPSFPSRSVTPMVATVIEAPVRKVALSLDMIKLRSVHIYYIPESLLVTAIEILSPANKRGVGFTQYTEKRNNLLRSNVHLVEIDLLRGGRCPIWELSEKERKETDYILLLNRSVPNYDRVSEIWPLTLDQPIPAISLPLLEGDPEIYLNLGQAIRNIYTDSNYFWRIDYSQSPPSPPLRPKIKKWWRDHQR